LLIRQSKQSLITQTHVFYPCIPCLLVLDSTTCTVADDSLGMPVIFTLIDAAQQWINSNVQEVVDTSTDEEASCRV
jgi:hypothetical protein